MGFVKRQTQFLNFWDVFFIHVRFVSTTFFGGRVNGFKLFCKAQQDETIEYVDFTSLYPFVNKTKVYPVGHSTIIHENFDDISNYFVLLN